MGRAEGSREVGMYSMQVVGCLTDLVISVKVNLH